MSEAFYTGLWQMLLASALAAFLAWIAERTKRAVDKGNIVAEKTHTLVNSNMGVQLSLHAATARRLAAITGHHEDRAAADLAEKLRREHNSRQDVVDSNEATRSGKS